MGRDHVSVTLQNVKSDTGTLAFPTSQPERKIKLIPIEMSELSSLYW
jgi:hypothetical protein